MKPDVRVFNAGQTLSDERRINRYAVRDVTVADK